MSRAYQTSVGEKASIPASTTSGARPFLEAGKQRLVGDTIREAGSDEVKELKTENAELKQLVAELSLRNRKLKKTSEDSGLGSLGT